MLHIRAFITSTPTPTHKATTSMHNRAHRPILCASLPLCLSDYVPPPLDTCSLPPLLALPSSLVLLFSRPPLLALSSSLVRLSSHPPPHLSSHPPHPPLPLTSPMASKKSNARGPCGRRSSFAGRKGQRGALTHAARRTRRRRVNTHPLPLSSCFARSKKSGQNSVSRARVKKKT
jgi:hypothetical protein